MRTEDKPLVCCEPDGISSAGLVALSESMMVRAREVVRRSGVREAWEGIGATVRQVGSMATALMMKHRDVDFHIYTDALDPAESFRAVSAICADPRVSQLEYRNLAATDEACLEWHILYDLDGEPWQIDMIQIRKGSRFDGHFERVAERINAVLTPETRDAILRLKYLTPDSDHIPGIAYYHAVLADGIRTWPQFTEWLREHQDSAPSPGIDLWCP